MLLRSSIFHWLFSVNSLNSDCLQISPSLAGGDLTASLEMTPGYACWIVPATLHFRGRMHIKVYFWLENASLLHWAVLGGPLKQNSQWCIWLQVGLWGYFCPAMQYCQECLHLNKKSLQRQDPHKQLCVLCWCGAYPHTSPLMSARPCEPGLHDYFSLRFRNKTRKFLVSLTASVMSKPVSSLVNTDETGQRDQRIWMQWEQHCTVRRVRLSMY